MYGWLHQSWLNSLLEKRQNKESRSRVSLNSCLFKAADGISWRTDRKFSIHLFVDSVWKFDRMRFAWCCMSVVITRISLFSCKKIMQKIIAFTQRKNLSLTCRYSFRLEFHQYVPYKYAIISWRKYHENFPQMKQSIPLAALLWYHAANAYSVFLEA